MVLEIGADTAIPTARRFGEAIGCQMIRLNLGESQVGRRRAFAISLGGERLMALAGFTPRTRR